MPLKVQETNHVKVYNVTAGKSIPEWLKEKQSKKALKKEDEYRRRVELLQDFEFQSACQKLRATSDGQYIFASGYHPPQVRVYQLDQLSEKFSRHLTSEIVDFQILSDDYSKIVFICADRSVVFHTRFGLHHSLRVPKFPRTLAYIPHTADLCVAGSAPEVWRVNLTEGRFYQPLETRESAVNCCSVAPALGLFAVGGEDGGVECFDMRAKNAVGYLKAAQALGAASAEVTALKFDPGGLNLGVGTSTGLAAIFDIRSTAPLASYDHMYGSPVRTLEFHRDAATAGGTKRVVSADRHAVRVWGAEDGEAWASVEPQGGVEINDVLLWPESGLLLVGCESRKIQAFFLPQLGPAPRWCSFLDSLTEEADNDAEGAQVYDDYQFVTRAELQRVGLSHLLGTPLLKPYLHGYFIHDKLWRRARDMSRPFEYETYRQQRVEAAIQAQRGSRIALPRKLPKVNARKAAELMAEAAVATQEGAAPSEPGLMTDSRFAAMFEDPQFAIDERAPEYVVQHPHAAKRSDKVAELLNEYFDEEDLDGQVASHDDDKATEVNNGEGGAQPEVSRKRVRVFSAKTPDAVRMYREGSRRQDLRVPLGQRLDMGKGPREERQRRRGGGRVRGGRGRRGRGR